MPPIPGLQLDVSRRIEAALQATGRKGILTAIERAEGLARELDAGRTYPDDFVFYRIVGQRTAAAGAKQCSGEAALSDLACLVERLSEQISLKPSELKDAVPAGELCERWSISRKTLDRMRRRGLIGRRVEGGDGVVRIVFMPETAAWFEGARQSELGRATRFTRIPEDAQARIIRNAARYKKWAGLTLNASALLLARRLGRSHEAVRQVLRRHDVRFPERALFDEAPPVNAERRAVIFRAWRIGIPIADMAKKYRRSLASIRRGIAIERAERLNHHLADGSLEGPVLPTFAMADAEEVILAPASVKTGMGEGGERSLSAFLALPHDKALPPADEERARLIAYHFLRYRILTLIASLDRAHPQAQTIDKAETMLRWASRLKVELMRPYLPLMLETIQGRLGRGLADSPLPAVLSVLRIAFSTLGGVVDMGDPLRTGRLAAPIGLALDRAVTKWIKEQTPVALGNSPGRATPRPPAGTTIADWTRRVSPWQEWTELPERIGRLLAAGKLPGGDGTVLRARYGLSGDRPLTVAEWAASTGQSPIRASIIDHRAYGEVLALARRAAGA